MTRTPRTTAYVGRKRRAAGWATLALCVLAAAMWLASGRWWLGLITTHRIHWIHDHWFTYEWSSYKHPEKGPRLVDARAHHDDAVAAMAGSVPFLQMMDGIVWDQQRYWVVYHAEGKGGFTGRPCAVRWSLPLWPLPAACAVVSGLLWLSLLISRRRASGRAAQNACVGCGYCRAGLNVSEPCPECGRLFTPLAP